MTELADVRCQSACTCHSADASVVPWCGDLLRNSRSVPGELSRVELWGLNGSLVPSRELEGHRRTG